jgi:hypothetical protein
MPDPAAQRHALRPDAPHHEDGTRALLTCGMVAGPFYLAVGIVQGVLRDGFDFSQHALSHLANGAWGWIQTLNLTIGGVLVVAAAMGVHRTLRANTRMPGRVISATILLALFGIGMIGSAAFPADPVAGFPPGTPDLMPTTVSTTGLLHYLMGGLGFLALAASAILTMFPMRERGYHTMAYFSVFAGLSIIAGFFAPMLGLRSPVLGIWYAVLVGWLWLLILCQLLLREQARRRKHTLD